jgi:hypothetical protein
MTVVPSSDKTSIAKTNNVPGPTRQIALRLPHAMVDWLELRAKQDDRSFAYVVKKIIEAEMARERKKAAREK